MSVEEMAKSLPALAGEAEGAGHPPIQARDVGIDPVELLGGGVGVVILIQAVADRDGPVQLRQDVAIGAEIEGVIIGGGVLRLAQGENVAVKQIQLGVVDEIHVDRLRVGLLLGKERFIGIRRAAHGGHAGQIKSLDHGIAETERGAVVPADRPVVGDGIGSIHLGDVEGERARGAPDALVEDERGAGIGIVLPGNAEKLAEIHAKGRVDADQARLAAVRGAERQRLRQRALGGALREDVGVVTDAVGGGHEYLVFAVVENQQGVGCPSRHCDSQEQ